ncbi:MAG: twin-arginine translocase TatA/TatE family subunit [Rhodobacteraceae bacterium]|nr:twin-arginine translocase TatA/TatE family subunit [Paracoccaceae bacterium]
MTPSIWQILIVVILAVLLFGRGKISSLMGDVAKGINAFKKGMKDGVEEDQQAGHKTIDGDARVDMSAEQKPKERYES